MPGSIEKANLCLARLMSLASHWNGRHISSISISAGVASNRDHSSIKAIAPRRIETCMTASENTTRAPEKTGKSGDVTQLRIRGAGNGRSGRAWNSKEPLLS